MHSEFTNNFPLRSLVQLVGECFIKTAQTVLSSRVYETPAPISKQQQAKRSAWVRLYATLLHFQLPLRPSTSLFPPCFLFPRSSNWNNKSLRVLEQLWINGERNEV